MNQHLMGSSRLTQYFPALRSYVPTKNATAILRHPNQVILAIPDGMVRFHPATLCRNRCIPARLKGVGFPYPLSGTLNRPVVGGDPRGIGADDFGERIAPRAEQGRHQIVLDVVDQPDAFVDQRGIKLDQACARTDLG